jgi:hypothetical protein
MIQWSRPKQVLQDRAEELQTLLAAERANRAKALENRRVSTIVPKAKNKVVPVAESKLVDAASSEDAVAQVHSILCCCCLSGRLRGVLTRGMALSRR